jgi:hypothetical protein
MGSTKLHFPRDPGDLSYCDATDSVSLAAILEQGIRDADERGKDGSQTKAYIK